MQPRLCEFSTNLNSYNGSGVKGLFTKIISNEARQVLKGEYTYEIDISVDDPLSSIVNIGMTIFAKPDDNTQPQIFIIKRIDVEDDVFHIYAEHVKTLFFANMILSDPYMTPVVYRGTPKSVVDSVLENDIVLPNYFTFASTISNKVLVDVGTEQKTLGELFLNTKNGLVAQVDADFIYNNFTISFVPFAGTAEPRYSVRYGVNLKSFSFEGSFEDSYTHILPYAEVKTTDDYTGDIDSVRIYKDVGNPLIQTAPFPPGYINILPVDFSEKFKNKHGYVNPQTGDGYSTVREMLTTFSNKYNVENPKLSDVSANVRVELESDLETFYKPRLGDQVWVIYEPLNYKKIHRITEIRYDSVNEKVKSLTISDGKKPYSLYNFITGKRTYL